MKAISPDPPSLRWSAESPSRDDRALARSTMYHMTHANIIFDWILQAQGDHQNRINRLQMMATASAMKAVANLSTLLMQQARLPDERIRPVQRLLERFGASAESLIHLQRD